MMKDRRLRGIFWFAVARFADRLHGVVDVFSVAFDAAASSRENIRKCSNYARCFIFSDDTRTYFCAKTRAQKSFMHARCIGRHLRRVRAQGDALSAPRFLKFIVRWAEFLDTVRRRSGPFRRQV